MSKNFNIIIKDSDESFTCHGDENLLKGMARLGHKGIPVGCRNGGCGVCKIKVISGDYESGLMSRAHVSVDEENEGMALACRVFPKTDIELIVLGKMKQDLESQTPALYQSTATK